MSLDKVLNNVWEQSRGDQWEEDYGFTMEAAKEAILTDLLEIIGDPDKQELWAQDCEKYAKKLIDKVRKYCE